MRISTLIIFISLIIASCKSESHECNCSECPEEKTRDGQSLTRPESFNEKSQFLLNLKLDTTYIKQINSDTLSPHGIFPGCENDVGQEGHPFILQNLDYFLIQEWQMSEMISLKLLYGELPKDTVQEEVDYYRALYFATFDNKGNHIDTKLVGKRKIVDNIDERYESVFTNVENNDLIISTHEEWYSSSGRFYSLWSDNHFEITKKGHFVEEIII
jgi:hypothetical protein